MIDYKNTLIALLLFVIEVVKPFWPFILGQVFVSTIWAVDISLSPYLVKLILDRISNTGLSIFDPYNIIPLVICYISIAVIIALVMRFYEWILLKFYPYFKKQISISLMTRILNHSNQFYQNNFSGSIANKISDVTDGIPNLLHNLIDRLFSHFLALLIAIYTVWSVDLRFSIGLICWIIIFLYISINLSNKASILVHKAAEVNSIIAGNIVDILSNITSVRLFVSKKLETNMITQIYKYNINAEQKRDWFFIKIHALQESSFILFQCLCFWWLIQGLHNQEITTGDFALIVMLNISILQCLNSLSRDIREFAEIFGKITQGFSTINAMQEIRDKINAKNIIITRGEIVFQEVQFYYDSSKPIFKNKTVTIHAGQKVGLVGYSGSGKSTFVHLILRLYDVTKGSIQIDGQDIRDVTQESLHNAIGIIPQDLSLFKRPLIENIRYGRTDASDDEVIAAAKRADAHDFICSLPDKYNTLVGEKGVKLSGGERQRIAIARTILKNAPILILDEATSHLDSVTEQYIQESLASVMNQKTTIVIAHRLSTLLHMDRILVFDQGKIVQDGTHADLVMNDGLYKKLWDTQVNGFLLDMK